MFAGPFRKFAEFCVFARYCIFLFAGLVLSILEVYYGDGTRTIWEWDILCQET